MIWNSANTSMVGKPIHSVVDNEGNQLDTSNLMELDTETGRTVRKYNDGSLKVGRAPAPLRVFFKAKED